MHGVISLSDVIKIFETWKLCLNMEKNILE